MLFSVLFAALATLATGVVATPIAERQTGCTLTWNGSTITGYADGSEGVCRYTVRYGTASRWTDSVATTS